jgi:hypothetical protein
MRCNAGAIHLKFASNSPAPNHGHATSIFSGPRRQAWALAGLSLPALLALPHAARADVYEITAGGTMRARSGAGAVHWAGVDVAAAQPGDGPEPAACPSDRKWRP